MKLATYPIAKNHRTKITDISGDLPISGAHDKPNPNTVDYYKQKL